MVGQKVLLTATLVAGLTLVPVAAARACDSADLRLGTCAAANTSGPGVDVTEVRTSETASDSRAPRLTIAHRLLSGGARSHCDTLCTYLKTHPDDPSLHLAMRPTPGSAVIATPPRPAASTPARAATRTPARVVTAQDVAHFLAAVGTVHAEPDGWAVVGVPANYWIDVQPFTVDGTLLDEAAQVRFTPTAYRWDYGDGSGRTTTTGGASWSALGQAELTATPTSHAFASTGTRTVRVTVAFAAEYRLGVGVWSAVNGEVTASAPPVPVRVVVERTLLTATG